LFDRIVMKIVIAAAVLAGGAALAAVLLGRRLPAKDAPVPRSDDSSRVLWIMLGFAAAAWMALVYLGEYFTFWDHDLFFASLRGAPMRSDAPVWPRFGRFFPLGNQEYTLLGLIDTSGVLYKLFAALELLVAVAVSLRAIRAPATVAFLALAGIASSPSVLGAHLPLIAVERNQILLIGLTLLGSSRFLEGGRPWGAALAAGSAFLLLFYKEASAAIVGGLCLWLFVWALRHRKGEWHRPLALSVLLGIGVVVFLGAYLILVQRYVETSYLEGRAVQFGVAARAITMQPWFWALGPAVGVRVVSRRGDPALDGLLLGAALYGVGIVWLGLQWPYFSAPVAFVAWIYIAAAADQLRAPLARKVAMGACAAVIVASLSPAFDTVRIQKGLVGAKEDAARFLADYYSARSGLVGDATPLVLHFPSGGYAGGLLGGYTHAAFRVPVVVAVPDGAGGTLLNRCPFLAGVDCQYGRPRKPGDLVVTLAPEEEDAARREGLAQLFASANSIWRNPQYRTGVFLAR
jgi:hypothetical protein